MTFKKKTQEDGTYKSNYIDNYIKCKYAQFHLKRLSDWMKNDQIYALQEIRFKYKDTDIKSK